MKVFFIDNEDGLLKYNLEGKDTMPVLIAQNNKQTAYEIASVANEKWQGEDCEVIVINVHLKNMYARVVNDCLGLEVLKEIRANEHFLGKENRLKSTFIVLYSPFSVQKLLSLSAENLICVSPQTLLTNSIEDVNFEDLEIKGLLRKQELAAYFQVGFTLPEARHGYANWWGAYMFAANLNLIYSDGFYNELIHSLMKNSDAQIRAAKFLYGHQSKQMPTEVTVKAKQRITAYRNQLKGLKIGLIDDEAMNITGTPEVGWADLFSILLFGKKNKVEVIAATQTADEMLGNIDESFDCILLDLHLDKQEFGRNAEDTKAAALLEDIKKRFPFLPVVITTASNKAQKRKIMRNIGCDAYWIKEGIEEQLNETESMERMLRLCDILGIVTGEKYQFLSKCMSVIRSFETQEMWWEYREWRWREDGMTRSECVEVDKSEIVDLLRQELLVLRSFLQHSIVGEGFQTKRDETAWFVGIIVRLGALIERIHGGGEGSVVDSVLMKWRKDYIGQLLYHQRHRAAHYGKNRQTDIFFVMGYIKKILFYLHTSPPSNRRIQDVFYDRNLSNSEKIKRILKFTPAYRAMVGRCF